MGSLSPRLAPQIQDDQLVQHAHILGRRNASVIGLS